MSGDVAMLPALRQELSLLPAPQGDDGAPRWFLFDPVRNAFHLLTRQAVDILNEWKNGPAAETLSRLKKSYPDMEADEDMLKEMAEFLFEQKLTEIPPMGDPEILARQEAATRRPFYEIMIHKYLFFRIPLFQPRKFLIATSPYIEFLFKKSTWIIIASMGLIGLYFAARQWEQFWTTFMYFFTLEGFVFYALTLIIIKALHELGHAFTAHHFGARVPIIGLAFLVMFPVLYTDTTDAWRLTSRRQRLLIDAGGMITELAIASIAIFLWSFLPDGPARSAAFFAATTSWVLSLMVNLNPCMRFDGYYLLGDFFRVQNMQVSGFELGRWKMREFLFGLGLPKPVPAAPRKQFGLLTYAYLTWVYRFFLFIGIALLVHHLFPKAIGIVLFTVEILFFIVMPMWREIKHWWNLRMTIISTRRGCTTLALTTAALAIFLVPWQTKISAPALLRPALQTEIFPISPAQVEMVHVKTGQRVSQGERLVSLSSETLKFERAQSIQRLTLLSAQINRQASSLEERRLGATLNDEYTAEKMSLRAIDDALAQLTIYAPHDGIISDIPTELHRERYIRLTDRLMRVISPASQELLALPNEVDAVRVSQNAAFIFISDDASFAKVKGHLTALAPTSEAVISEPILTSISGGPLAVNEDKDGQLIANSPVFKVRGKPAQSVLSPRAQRGIVKIKARPQSPAATLWRSIVRVLIRETDF